MSYGNSLTYAVGAGLAARAIEPHAGESTGGHTHESCCLNRRTALVGSQCHACGQAADVHPQSVVSMADARRDEYIATLDRKTPRIDHYKDIGFWFS